MLFAKCVSRFWKKTAQRAWIPGRLLSKAACWPFIFSFSFIIFIFFMPLYNFVFLILSSFLFLSPLGDILLYIRNPFKLHLEQNKSPKNLTHLQFYIRNPFNFFFYPLWGIVPFYIRNLLKIHLEQKKSSPKKLNSSLILHKKPLRI